MYGYGYGMGIWMVVGWIIMATVVVFALYGLMILLRRSEPAFVTEKSPDALELLKQRLAKGEITIEEYNKIKNELLKK